MTAEGPAPELFLSGVVGHVGPRRARALRLADRALDLALRAARAPAVLDRLARESPKRRVLALGVYRPGSRQIGAVVDELRRSRHSLRLALGCMGDPPAALAPHTTAAALDGGKFENLNELLRRAGGEPYDWLLVVDDDVALPKRFVDRLLGLCERLDLALAQPAQGLASHAAWPVVRRRPGSLARVTRFVEIGPVTALRSDVARELTPFPELRFGWGLDLHWSALARERGWRQGVLDALPVRHEQAGVADSYAHDEAVAEAQRFLAGRPFVSASEAAGTVAVHRWLA